MNRNLQKLNNLIGVSVLVSTIFAAQMKKIATILVVLFMLVQVAPAICTVFSIQTSLFVVDEEKSPEKIEKSEKKQDYQFRTPLLCELSYDQKIQTAFLLSEKIALFPFLEEHSPPPDHI